MQSTSNTYKSLLYASGTRKEVKVNIGGEDYLENRIHSMNTRNSIFASDMPEIGCVIAREISIEVRDIGTIPRMAEIKPYIRLVNGNTTSEWIQKGTFYIDTREFDVESGILTINGYDSILKTESSYTTSGVQDGWPKKDIDVVDIICERIGVNLDSRTRAIMTRRFDIQYPGYGEGAYTMRQVLGYIGGMYAGNWIMSDIGELRLIVFGDIPAETHYMVTEYGAAITLGGVRILV